MRIAIFTDTYRPEINGVVISIDTYRDELERQGHEVWVFAPRYFGRRDPTPRTVRVPSIPFPFKMMKERRLAFMGPIRLLRFGRLHFDVIHSQVPALMGIAALVASALWRVPHVHTYHTHYMEYTHYMPFPPHFARRAVIWIARHFCGRTSEVVAPSAGIKEAIQQYGVDAPVTVVPTGIDLRGRESDTPLSTLVTRYCLRPVSDLQGRRILTSVGRLGREKNIRFLMRAFARMLESEPALHFLMIGDGPDRGEVEREIELLGISDHVTLTGYVARNDVLSFLRASDLFIFASKTETQGLVLLEAMAVGTPVVAIRATGVSDLMGDDHGGFATHDSVPEFTERTLELLHSPRLMKRKKAEALERAELWSVENQARRLVGIYGAAIREFRRHGLPRYRHRRRY